MKPILGLALSLSFLLLSSVPVVGDTWPMLPDVNLLWQNTSNREGNLVDFASGVAVKDGRVFAVGESETTAGSSAFTVKAFNASNGKLLWENNYDREGEGWDGAYAVVADNDKVFVSGSTATAAGGSAFAVRAYDAKKGKLLWENNYDREGDLPLWDESWDMTVKDNKVFAVGTTETAAGGNAFAVRAYDATSGKLLWDDNYDRVGGVLWDVAYRAVAKDDRLFVVGQTMTAAGGSAFTIRTYDTSSGKLLWENNYDREGSLWDGAYDVVVEDDNVFVVGSTQTAAGGWGLTVRAYNAKEGKLLWQDNYDREGALTDTAYGVAVKDGRLFVTGTSETTAGGSAFAIRTYDAKKGKLLWENNYDREGTFYDSAGSVTVAGNTVYAVGETVTASGNAFTVRAYNAKDGKLVYEDYQTPEASLQWNGAIGVAAEDDKVFVSGVTETTAGGMGFAVRAYKAKEGDDDDDDDKEKEKEGKS